MALKQEHPERGGEGDLTTDLTPQDPTATGSEAAPREGIDLNDYPIPHVPFGLPMEIWNAIAIEYLTWSQTLQLANSCAFLIPLRHSLDLRQKHLLAPERVAFEILKYRKQEGSRFITKLITKDGKKNNIALRNEITAGLDIFKQWWRYEPYEPKPPGSHYRQTETTRQSDLDYAVLRGRKHMLRRYWRFRSIV